MKSVGYVLFILDYLRSVCFLTLTGTFQSAPKIGQSNMGFKMLALMGWAEGDRIGLSGGLEAPLVAIVKHSKLGLGAMK